MSIQQECETLQALLCTTLDLITEVDVAASPLSESSISEATAKLRIVLELCDEGQQNLQRSLEQIELLASMLGVSSGSSSATKTSGKDFQDSFGGLVDLCTSCFKQVPSLTIEMLNNAAKTTKNAQSIIMIATAIVGGLMAKSTEVYADIILPAADLFEMIPKDSGLSSTNNMQDECKVQNLSSNAEGKEQYLGINIKEYEQLEVEKDKKRKEEKSKRQMKRSDDLSAGAGK